MSNDRLALLARPNNTWHTRDDTLHHAVGHRTCAHVLGDVFDPQVPQCATLCLVADDVRLLTKCEPQRREGWVVGIASQRTAYCAPVVAG